MHFLNSILSIAYRIVMFLVLLVCGYFVFLYVIVIIFALWTQYPPPMLNSVLIPAQLGELTPRDQGHSVAFIEGCGASVFSLNSEIVEQISLKKLLFFEHAHTARNNQRGYSQWYKTPLIEDVADGENNKGYNSYGAYWAGLRCAEEHGMSKKLVDNIRNEYNKTGNYYSITHEGVIFVSPRLGVVVFAYFG